MSASGITDWSVTCNGPACPKVVWASALGIYGALHGDGNSAQELREALKEQGWTVDVPEGVMNRRLDFCPAHSGEAATAAGKEN